MRCYQHIGLTEEAKAFLRENVEMIPNQVCPKCGEVLSTKMNCRIIRHLELFYDDGPSECEYKLKDGTTCRESLQAAPWSSGPMGFMCLETDSGLIFKWSQEEINKY